MLQAEQRLYHATGEAKRTFPTHKSRQLLCPKPKVMPRFSLGDVGEARWPLSHRWTETSHILPDVAHDSRNQRHVGSFSALSLLSRVRPTPPATGSSSQLAANESLTAHGRSAQQPTVHLHISDVTPVRHAQGTLSILSAFVACAAVQTAWCLSCLGRYSPRTNARCVVGQ